MPVLLKSAGYRDAPKGTEQAGSAGKQQDGHMQSTLFSRSAHELSKVVSAWLCRAYVLVYQGASQQHTSLPNMGKLSYFQTVLTKKSHETPGKHKKILHLPAWDIFQCV